MVRFTINFILKALLLALATSLFAPGTALAVTTNNSLPTMFNGIAILFAMFALMLPQISYPQIVRLGQLICGLAIIVISLATWLVPGVSPSAGLGSMASYSSLELCLWGVALFISQWPKHGARPIGIINILLVTIVVLSSLELAGNLIEREFAHGITGFSWNDWITIATLVLTSLLWLSFRQADWYQQQNKDKHEQDILLMTGAILLFVVLLAGLSGFLLMANTTKNMLMQTVQTSLASRAQVLHDTLINAANNAFLISERPRLRVLLQKFDRSSLSAEERQEVSKIMDNILGTTGSAAITIYDSKGRKLDQRGTLLLQTVANLPLTIKGGGSLLWHKGSMYQTTLPMTLDGQVIGKVAIIIPMPGIDRLFDETGGIGSGGTLAVCAPDGSMMQCLPNRSNKFQGYRGPRVVNGRELPMEHAFKAETGVSAGIDAHGNHVLAAHAPVGSLGIGAVVKALTDELYAPIRARLKSIFTLLMMVIFVGLLLIRWRLAPLASKLVSESKERKLAEDRLGHMARHDALTGLPNRLLLMALLDQALEAAQHRKRLVAIMFIDLDRFKYINDGLGHEFGDSLLRAVATRLESYLRHGDIVARQGGDEFTMVFSDIAAEDDVSLLVERVQEGLIKPFLINGHEIVTTASIGVAIYPTDGDNSETLVKNADIAAYRAKDQGRDTYQFFKPELQEKAERHVKLQQDLRRAVENNELFLVYQPVVDLKTGRITSAEALLRWKHPERGFVSPLDFIPLAEETGLILPIGEWVLKTACQQARALKSAGLPAIRIAVNLAARQLAQVDIVETVSRILTETAVHPNQIGLELTESSLIQNADAAKKTLDQFSGLGIHISIDDFGTGYSSLSYLQRFPIDTLKIDRSFVQHLPNNPDNNAIATAIVTLAHALQMSVVAEGVETAEQQNYLASIACESMQGYLFSKPIPAEEFAALLAKNTAEVAVV